MVTRKTADSDLEPATATGGTADELTELNRRLAEEAAAATTAEARAARQSPSTDE